MTVPPQPEPTAPGVYEADVAILGAGVAGLFAVTQLPSGLDVVVVDKGEAGRSGSSPWAQGGMAVALGPDDSPELHANDTIRASDGLCDHGAVMALVREAPDRIRDLIAFGARFDVVADGDPEKVEDLHLAREGGQSVARSVHRADATGAELVRALRAAAAPSATRLPGTAVQLARSPTGRVGGVWVWHPDDGLVHLRAGAVLLATGGCGGLFAATTNQDHATGDGLALAYAAGAAVRDVEFVQFHPTGLAVSGSWRFLLTEALRGAGATLHDREGRRFLVERHPDAELAPRHVVAQAILDQPGGAWLDATHLADGVLEEEFPTVLAGAREHGFDLATERVPVTPAAHYMVGGVRTDLQGRTSLPGLYAAGEAASTGVHGANRMAGNSLTEAMVFAARTATTIGLELAAPGPEAPPPDLSGAGVAPDELVAIREQLRETMWQGVGPVRSRASLAVATEELRRLAERLGPPAPDAEHVELHLALQAARLITAAAGMRTESRGGHFRDDHPSPDPAWSDVHVELARPARAASDA